MLLLLLEIPLLLLQVAITGATPTNHHKRWLGVRPLKDDISKGAFGPWPPICTGQAVRYCFANARSQTNLEPIVNQAVAKWAHAFLNSRLQIVPDNEEALLCNSPAVRADALVISDATKDNDKKWNSVPDCPTDSASTGYGYDSDVTVLIGVAQLYPKTDGSSQDAMDLGKWGTAKGKRLKVKVRGVEVVVEAPRPPQST